MFGKKTSVTNIRQLMLGKEDKRDKYKAINALKRRQV